MSFTSLKRKGHKPASVIDLDPYLDFWGSDRRFRADDYKGVFRDLPRKWWKCVDKTLFKCPDASFCKTDSLTGEPIDSSDGCLAMPLELASTGEGQCATVESARSFWRASRFEPQDVRYMVKDSLRPFLLLPSDRTWSDKHPECAPDPDWRVAESEELTVAQRTLLRGFGPIHERVMVWTSSDEFKAFRDEVSLFFFEDVSHWRGAPWYDMEPSEALPLARMHLLFFLSKSLNTGMACETWLESAIPEVASSRKKMERDLQQKIAGLLELERSKSSNRAWWDWLTGKPAVPEEDDRRESCFRATLRYLVATTLVLRDFVTLWRQARTQSGATHLDAELAVRHILQHTEAMNCVLQERLDGRCFWLSGIPVVCSLWLVVVDSVSGFSPLSAEERSTLVRVVEGCISTSFPDLGALLPDWRELLGVSSKTNRQLTERRTGSFYRSPQFVEFMISLHDACAANYEDFHSCQEDQRKRGSVRHFARAWREAQLPLSETASSSFSLAVSLARMFFLRVASSKSVVRAHTQRVADSDYELRMGLSMHVEQARFREELEAHRELDRRAIEKHLFDSVKAHADEADSVDMNGPDARLFKVLSDRLLVIRSERIFESSAWRIHTHWREKMQIVQQLISVSVTPYLFLNFESLARCVDDEWPPEESHARDQQARIVAFAQLVAMFSVLCLSFNFDEEDQKLLTECFCTLLSLQMYPRPVTFVEHWKEIAFP